MNVKDIQAIVFDFDGVIADTEPLHHQSFCAVVEKDGLGCPWETYHQDYIGYDDRDLFRAFYGHHDRALSEDELAGLVEAKAQAFIALAEQGVEPYAGIPDLVHQAAALVPIAICSGALRSDIDPILSQLGLTDTFPVIVTAEDVALSKPDPTCYRLAVQRLSECTDRMFLPERVVAIEDSPTGIRAAREAGLTVWAVTHTHGTAQVAGAHRVFDHMPAIQQELEGLV